MAAHLQDRWADLSRRAAGRVRRAALEAETEADVVDGAFGHGYLLVRGSGRRARRTPALVRGWPTRTIGGFTYYLHPRTVVSTSAADRPERAVLLGHPVDVDAGITDGTVLAQRVADALRTAGTEAAVRYAAYLGGRWTLVLHRRGASGEQLTVVPDTHASQPVYWSDRGGLALASGDALVADALGLPPDEDALALLAAAKRVRRTGVVHLPGLLTPFRHVLPLVPNCLLEVTAGEGSPRVVHRRFWPFQEHVERTDVDAVAREFRDRMSEHTRLLTRFGRPVISLTAGLDSRVSLASFLAHRTPQSFAFTYFNPRDSVRQPGAAEDVFGASRLCFRTGLPHRVLRWRDPAPGSTFDRIYRRTYPLQRGSRGAPHAMWADLPHDIVHLQSIGGETGTVFPRMRNSDPISPRKLAQLWLGHRFGDQPRFHQVFEPYLEYAQFTEEAMRGYNHHDLNYWEHRMGRWGCRKFQDGDFSHRMLLPYNDRTLIETMLSLPEPLRIEKVLYQRLLAEHPELSL